MDRFLRALPASAAGRARFSEKEKRDPVQSQIMGIIIAAAATLFAVPPARAAASDPAVAPSSETRPDPSVRPDLIYHNYCSVCHGDRGDGRSRARASLNPPPADFTSAEARTTLSRERMILALNHGRPGTAMTAWTTQLSAKEIAAVVDYIRETMMAPEPGSPLARGRALYGHHCVACHGGRGEGVASSPSHPAPRPFARDADRAQMLAAVSQGRFGSLKHEFAGRLKAGEIDDTVDYVRKALAPALQVEISGTRAHGGRGRDAEAPADRGAGATMTAAAAMPEGLTGDPERGRRLYEQNCVACHGAEGDGKGARSALLGTKVRDFAASSYNRPALYAAIAAGRAGTDMPAWRAVLGRQQIADVAEYVWRTHFRAPKPVRAER